MEAVDAELFKRLLTDAFKESCPDCRTAASFYDFFEDDDVPMASFRCGYEQRCSRTSCTDILYAA